MHILFWLSISFDRRATSEHLLSAMVESLYKMGHEVHILQKDTGGERDALPMCLKKLGVSTTRIKVPQPKKSNLAARYLTDLQYIRRCKQWLKANRSFDRVFMQSSNVAGLQVQVLRRYLKNVPIVFNVQDIFPENAVYSGSLSQNGIPYRILSGLQKNAYRKADRIVTISEDMWEQLVELGVPSEKLTVIYNWSYQDVPYDASMLDFSHTAQFFDVSQFHVVYAGNIGMMQNVELVIRTAEKMRDYHDIRFHIFGDGLYKNKLVSMAQQKELDNLSFHPILDASDAPALYASADLNVIPLAKNIYRTALPSKTATCLACGNPIAFCVGTDSIFGQMLRDRAGVYLTGSDDSDALAETILAVRAGADTGRYGKLFCERFSRTENSGKYAALIIETQMKS